MLQQSPTTAASRGGRTSGVELKRVWSSNPGRVNLNWLLKLAPVTCAWSGVPLNSTPGYSCGDSNGIALIYGFDGPGYKVPVHHSF